MSGYAFKNGQGSVIIRVKLNDSSTIIADNKGLTGLTFSSSGLSISTIADNEAAATNYTQAGSTIETITTLGTFAAPTATKCRFKEVDSSAMPGWYEVQIADARWAVSSAKSLAISFKAVSGLNLAQTDLVVPLQVIDPYSITALFTAQMTESYAADGSAPTPAQALFLIQQFLTERNISGTTWLVKGLDGTTTKATLTLNNASTPTTVSRTG